MLEKAVFNGIRQLPSYRVLGHASNLKYAGFELLPSHQLKTPAGAKLSFAKHHQAANRMQQVREVVERMTSTLHREIGNLQACHLDPMPISRLIPQLVS